MLGHSASVMIFSAAESVSPCGVAGALHFPRVRRTPLTTCLMACPMKLAAFRRVFFLLRYHSSASFSIASHHVSDCLSDAARSPLTGFPVASHHLWVRLSVTAFHLSIGLSVGARCVGFSFRTYDLSEIVSIIGYHLWMGFFLVAFYAPRVLNGAARCLSGGFFMILRLMSDGFFGAARCLSTGFFMAWYRVSDGFSGAARCLSARLFIAVCYVYFTADHMLEAVSNAARRLLTGFLVAAHHIWQAVSSAARRLLAGFLIAVCHMSAGVCHAARRLSAGLIVTVHHISKGLSVGARYLWASLRTAARYMVAEVFCGAHNMSFMLDILSGAAEARATKWAGMAEAITFTGSVCSASRVEQSARDINVSIGSLEVPTVWIRTKWGVRDSVALICEFVSSENSWIQYRKGFGTSCASIFLSLGCNMAMTLTVYRKWAMVMTRFFSDENRASRRAGQRYAWEVLRDHCAGVGEWIVNHGPMHGNNNFIDEDAIAYRDLHDVFERSVCSMCSTLGLRSKVMVEVIESSLEAGGNMPAVSLWVTCALLSLAQQRDSSSGRAHPQHCAISDAVCSAAGRPRSFAALEAAAPMSLSAFIAGYTVAVAPPKSIEDSGGLLRSVMDTVHEWAFFAGDMVWSCW